MRRTCFEQDFVPEKIRPSQAFRQGPREGGRRSGAFKDDGDALADTDAHGAEGVAPVGAQELVERGGDEDRKSTRLNSSHANISYAVFCLKKKKNNNEQQT